MGAGVRTPVHVSGRTLTVNNLGKLLWPAEGITKAQLVDYYIRIAPYLMPHLKDRPLVMTRYPDGIDGNGFYNKDCPTGAPRWIRTWPYLTEDGRTLEFILVDEPATLAYVSNLGAIELHPWLSRCQSPDSPDYAVIDLDPAEGASFDDVLVLARVVHQLLAAAQIQGFPKLSGATGLHIYCPCQEDHTYRDTAEFCETIGRALMKLFPDKVTLERAVARRTGKVYVDYLQNRRGQTITTVYGLRPRPGAPVSAPVTWDEIHGEPPRFDIESIWPRLETHGDLFAPVLTVKQDLRPAQQELRRILTSM